MTKPKLGRRRASDQARRFGDELRLARAIQGMTRQHAAHRAGVAWSTIARAEAGDPALSVTTMCAIGEAVGLDVVLRVFTGRAPSLRDTGQLELAAQLRSLASPAWHPTIELNVGTHGESVDIAFFGTLEIMATEIERLAADFQGQYRRADAKRAILANQHQRPVRLVLAIEDTRRNRRALEPHGKLIRSSLPAGSREVLRALRTGEPLGRDGIVWLRRAVSAR